jgi:hypothetical protein
MLLGETPVATNVGATLSEFETTIKSVGKPRDARTAVVTGPLFPATSKSEITLAVHVPAAENCGIPRLPLQVPSNAVPLTRNRFTNKLTPVGDRKLTCTPDTPDRSSVNRAVMTIVCDAPETSMLVGVNANSSRVGGVTSEL